MINIKKEKCIGCGACVKDCLGKAIKLIDGKADYVRNCMHCGHCVAICPVGAVSIPGYDMEDVEEYEKDTFTVQPENFLRAVKFRRSIRNFKDEPIEREKMERILDVGRYTPTAKNRQECRFILVQNQLEEFKELVWKEMPKIVEKLKTDNPEYARVFELFYLRHQKDPGEDVFFFNSTSFLVIASENPLDGGLAAANIENMAVAEGAGVLYNGYMMRVIKASDTLQEWLGITDTPVSCCMLLGYPAVTYRRTAPRKKKNIEWK